jgi:hypothetical protein
MKVDKFPHKFHSHADLYFSLPNASLGDSRSNRVLPNLKDKRIMRAMEKDDCNNISNRSYGSSNHNKHDYSKARINRSRINRSTPWHPRGIYMIGVQSNRLVVCSLIDGYRYMFAS